MAKPQLLEEKALSLAELKDKLQHIKEKEKELNFRANKTEEYLNSITVLSTKEARELSKKIADLNVPRLKPEHIVKILDLLPRSANDCKLILQNSGLTITAENLKKITDLIKEHYQKQ